MNIDGNITAIIQKKIDSSKNVIGERTVDSWLDVGEVLGWLDYQAGQNDFQTYKSLIQDSSHVFLCDYEKWIDAKQDENINPKNARLIVDGDVYNILLIDDPMNLHQHLEIYLQFVGGGLGV